MTSIYNSMSPLNTLSTHRRNKLYKEMSEFTLPYSPIITRGMGSTAFYAYCAVTAKNLTSVFYGSAVEMGGAIYQVKEVKLNWQVVDGNYENFEIVFVLSKPYVKKTKAYLGNPAHDVYFEKLKVSQMATYEDFKFVDEPIYPKAAMGG